MMYSSPAFRTSDLHVIYLSVVNNIDYFLFLQNKYWYGEKFVITLNELLSHIQWYQESLKEFNENASCFDFNDVPGNGFRSFGLIFERCFSNCYEYCKRLITARDSMFFRAQKYLKEGESLVSVLSGLKPGLSFLNKMLINSGDQNTLMADKIFSAEELILECGNISQLGFYGRHQGFYYCSSMQRILQGVGVIVATFSDLYQTSGGPISRAALTILNGMKYIFNPELRAREIVDVAQNSSVEFLKAFWSLSETQFMKHLPDWVCPKLKVREEIIIPSVPIILNLDDIIMIPIPTSHIPVAPVKCLLLSKDFCDGQPTKKPQTVSPKSKSILFHCHGGGFISQTPESHEIYLRHWAHDLKVPIISVDYSLAPEAPFPRALEEVFFAYAWVLKNPDKLGWTGDAIYFAGDSAGGNILIGVVLRAIALGMRLPDFILCAYTPLILDLVPSPSRLLCWIDPLLPLGFMISCLDAYAGAMETDGDEYTDHVVRSRKVSSISDILDSSMSFLNEFQWTEVEGTDAESEDNVSGNCYIQNIYKAINKQPSVIKQSEEDFTDENILFDLPLDIVFEAKNRCKKIGEMCLGSIGEIFSSSYFYKNIISPFVPGIESKSTKQFKKQSASKAAILQKIKKLRIVSQNPYMSPLLAEDEVLKRMPPIHFISLNFDPCLDDSITFAKRLQSLNKPVKVDVLDGLPHGFLNFLPFSQEAHNGSNLCVRRLKEAMKL